MKKSNREVKRLNVRNTSHRDKETKAIKTAKEGELYQTLKLASVFGLVSTRRDGAKAKFISPRQTSFFFLPLSSSGVFLGRLSLNSWITLAIHIPRVIFYLSLALLSAIISRLFSHFSTSKKKEKKTRTKQSNTRQHAERRAQFNHLERGLL